MSDSASSARPSMAGHRGKLGDTRTVVLSLAGMAMLLAAVTLGFSAAWVRTSFDVIPDTWPGWDARGEYRFAAGVIDSPTGTVVIDVTSLDVTFPIVGDYGSTGLSIATADESSEVTLALAPAASIDSYLAGRAYDVAVRSGSTWSLTPVPGRQGQGGEPGIEGIADHWDRGDAERPPLVPWSDGEAGTVLASATSNPARMAVDLVFTWPGAGRAFCLLSIGALALAIAGGTLLAVAVGGRRDGRHVRVDDEAVPA